jgi:hypothetical protein
MSEWIVPSVWQGGECWIIAGGPSIPYQFSIPEEIIVAVKEKTKPPSVFSPYLQSIHNKHIIGINNAYRIGNWIDVLFFGDCNWFLAHNQSLNKFQGLKVSCCPRFAKKNKKYRGIKYLEKDSSRRHGISNNKSKVSWNANSGAAAISLAVHFGVKRIVLLGFDMRSQNKTSHWFGYHGLYPKKISYNRHLRGFPAIAKDAKRLGIEIINISPNSTIEEFPKKKVIELL